MRVFGDGRKTGGIPSMDAYLAQRGQPIRGPIHFGPNSACGRPGLAQYQLFLPLQQARPCSHHGVVLAAQACQLMEPACMLSSSIAQHHGCQGL